MNRRSFLTMAAALAGVPVPLAAEPQSRSPSLRAAVVIGVDSPAGLPPLSAAASSASDVAAWLASQRFDVALLTDERSPVSAASVYQSVDKFVQHDTTELLVVYFSGHGFLLGHAEFWLLSEALNNPNEAVNLDGSIDVARDCGIPHIVFISDACRSTMASLNSQSVSGSRIFRSSRTVRASRAEIDRFYATLPGDPAYELPVDKTRKEYQALYTSCFLDAFRHPDTDIIIRLADGTRVVPDRKLKPYLLVEMRNRIKAAGRSFRQDPDAIIESGEDTYIGKVADNVAVAAPPAGPLPSTLADVAAVQLAELNVLQDSATPVSKGVPAEAIARLAALSGFNATRDAVQNATRDAVRRAQLPDMAHPDGIDTGIVVVGASLAAVFPGRNVRYDVTTHGTAQRPTILRCLVEPGGSVLLQFDDKSGTPIAVLRNYIVTVVVADGRVLNVSYLPSQGIGEDTRERLNELHALVGTSFRFGVFRVSGDRATRDRQAEQLADRIRVLKAVDPVLGIYAAYAYAAAGLKEQVRSLYRILQGEGVVLFDIAMLANALRDTPQHPAPFSPMLSQGWALLPGPGAKLPAAVASARAHLRNAVWTTFEPAGVEILAKALASGGLP